MYHIGGNSYQLIKDHKNAWNVEVFRERYSEVLDRYDYIVGDWGYNQLRLKGFFKENQNKGAKDATITHLHDYLHEYCNFGCAYFIVEKLPAKKGQPGGEGADDEPEAEGTAPAIVIPDLSEEVVRTGEAAGELKPRQHYHRAGTEDRHKMAQERWGDGRGIPNDGRPKNPEAKPRPEHNRGGESRGGEGRGRGGPEGRSRDQEPRQRGQDGHHRHRNGENRKQEQRPRDPDNRPKHAEASGRDGENRPGGGRPRYQDQRGGGNKPHNQGGGESRPKGQAPREQQGQQAQSQGGKNKPHDRNRNRNREAEKEKAEPRL